MAEGDAATAEVPPEAAPAEIQPEEPTAPAYEPPAAPTDLLGRAQLRSGPHLTQDFVDKHQLDDEYLERVATGAEPGPPDPGASDAPMSYENGMWTRGDPNAVQGTIGAERRG
jgi:hypothetical protein